MKKIDHILKSICEVQPPEKFKEAVLARIWQARAEKMRSRKLLFRCGFVFSGAFLLVASMFFGKEILDCEFWSIASLVFSDLEIIATHWQSFGLSLLETFPTVAIAVMLTPVYLLLVLIKRYAQVSFDHVNIQACKHLNI